MREGFVRDVDLGLFLGGGEKREILVAHDELANLILDLVVGRRSGPLVLSED